MKSTKTLACLGLIASIGTAQAATILVTGAANATNKGTVNFGTWTVDELVADNTAYNAGVNEADRTITYTISGLTIDADGTANDSITVNFLVTSDGQNIQTSGTTLAGWLSSGGTTLNGNGDQLTIAFDSISDNLSGGGTDATLAFDGFSAVSWGSWASGHVAVVNGVSNAYDDGNTGNDFNKVQTVSGNSLVTWYDTTANTGAAANANGSWRAEGWDFSITSAAVPEPSSTALLGLGGLALIFRRRK